VTRPDIIGVTLALLDGWLSAPRDVPHDDAWNASGGHHADRTQGDADAVGRSDAEWLARIRAGEVLAFERVFFVHAAPLRRFTRAMVRSEASAEDIVQEVFAHLWERRETVEVKTTLRSYLYAAARGRALMMLRAAGVRDAYAAQVVTTDVLVIPARAPDALAGIEREELTRALGDALAGLSPRMRQAAELRWFGKLSHAEIAEVMGTSPATVNNQLTTALRTLRERLRPHFE